MNRKHKIRQQPANISIGGNVKGIGIVVGNDSQSNMTVSIPDQKSSPSQTPKTRSVWNVASGIVVNLLMNLLEKLFEKK